MKKGDVVEVTFLDHACTVGGLSDPITCRAIGEFVHQDKNAIFIASWITEENDLHNADSHTILKAVIKNLRVLRKSKHAKSNS